jgi:hypothetical protein
LSANGVPRLGLVASAAVHRRSVCCGTRSPVRPRSPIFCRPALSDPISLLVGSRVRTATPFLARSSCSAQTLVIIGHDCDSMQTCYIPAVVEQTVNVARSGQSNQWAATWHYCARSSLFPLHLSSKNDPRVDRRACDVGSASNAGLRLASRRLPPVRRPSRQQTSEGAAFRRVVLNATLKAHG